ncbi:CHASE2 domain-containing protein [Chondrinema litorale]|uniref:CHASE2 domain-containing protein n=1 Tax=Chondrinema litorale TaxID=2994555 RepID=UPI002542EF4B|nr:CHASE2 domain-containing protein [Chondrinema litorale]UZR93937.1 CHASE2 domain-containing protein [Chondrinema litorale]
MTPIFQEKRNTYVRIGLSIGHGVFLIIATLIYLSITFTLDDEIILIQLTAAVKNKLLGQKKRPDKDRLLLVNVSWDKKLIPRIDSTGTPIGNQAITNRASIAKLLQAMNQKPDNHEFLLIDVNFLDDSPDDSLLEAELLKVKNCLVSYHKDVKGKPLYPVVKAPLGLSDMQVDDEDRDLVLKYHLIQGDSLKTTPLLMYEKIHDAKFEEGFLYDKLDGKKIFNSFIIDYPVDQYDIFKRDMYNYLYLNEMVMASPSFIQAMTKDKIVIVGDFEDRDIHNTIYGKTPGPLILLNAFLALENGDNLVSIYFILLLLVAYSLISYKAITVNDPVTMWVKRKFKEYNFIIEFAADVTFYLIYFGIISIISYMSFGVHLTILFLSFYMHFLEVGLVALDERKKEKALAKANAATNETEVKKED